MGELVSMRYHTITMIFRDNSINIMEFTNLCRGMFRNASGKPYK